MAFTARTSFRNKLQEINTRYKLSELILIISWTLVLEKNQGFITVCSSIFPENQTIHDSELTQSAVIFTFYLNGWSIKTCVIEEVHSIKY